jgi:hypothetical protein
VKVKENKFDSDWLKELALASSPAQGLEPAKADNNTTELLGDTIIVSHPADKANPNHTGNGLSAPSIARIDESEEEHVPECQEYAYVIGASVKTLIKGAGVLPHHHHHYNYYLEHIIKNLLNTISLASI